jgi:hypothetical protein
MFLGFYSITISHKESFAIFEGVVKLEKCPIITFKGRYDSKLEASDSFYCHILDSRKTFGMKF